MPITVEGQQGPLILGPGARLFATSSLLPLDNPPFTWLWHFVAADNVFNFTQQRITTTTEAGCPMEVLWDDFQTPAQLLSSIHADEGTQVTMTVEVRNQANEQVDVSTPTQVRWQPQVWSHLNSLLWANNVVSRISTGTGSDQLDRIESAVYQVFPHG